MAKKPAKKEEKPSLKDAPHDDRDMAADRLTYTSPSQFKVIGERPADAKGWDDEDDDPATDDK